MLEEIEELLAETRAFILESRMGTSTDEARFNRLALRLFHFQFQRIRPYQAYCLNQRVAPGAIDHWSAIPAVPTAAFKEWELTTLPQAQRIRVFHSSGTTEQRPSRHFHSAQTLALYEDSLLHWFKPCFMPEASRLNFVFLTPESELAGNSSLSHMFRTIDEHLCGDKGLFVGKLDDHLRWEVDLDRVQEVLTDLCREDTPIALCGTAFLFVHLCDWLREQNIRFQLPSKSRILETGGYKGRSRSVEKEELHQMISERMGISTLQIVSEYGMSELSSQAYDLRLGMSTQRCFQFPPWARAVTISPETGKLAANGVKGLIRIHDLANVASVAAIQTEDLGISSETGFELYGRVTTAERRGCSLLAK